MNQKSKQKATSSVKRDFFELLNNSNFGIDCRNNCILESLYDNLGEISYIKRSTTIFNGDPFRYSFSPEHMKEETSQTFQGKIFALDKNDPAYEARKEYWNTLKIKWMKSSMQLSLLKKVKTREK